MSGLYCCSTSMAVFAIPPKRNGQRRNQTLRLAGSCASLFRPADPVQGALSGLPYGWGLFPRSLHPLVGNFPNAGDVSGNGRK